jgi:hypothetical protein
VSELLLLNRMLQGDWWSGGTLSPHWPPPEEVVRYTFDLPLLLLLLLLLLHMSPHCAG